MDQIDTYIYDIKVSQQLDTQVRLASNIVIFGLAIGTKKSQELFAKLDKFYNGYSEEVCCAIANRLGDLLRITAEKVEDISIETVNYYFGHIKNLSNLNSSQINRSIKYSFDCFITFFNMFKEQTLTFLQQLQASQNTLQRVLVAQLIPSFYAAADTEILKTGSGTLFGQLISDTDALVRANAAQTLSQLLQKLLEDGKQDKFIYSPSYMYVCYDRLVQDLSDIVRANNCKNGVLVLKFLLQIQQQDPESKEIKEVLPGLIKNISRGSSDRYWKVRMQTAQSIPEFFDLISKKLDVQDCAVMFRLLSEDCEPDIRVTSLYNSPKILKYLDCNSIVNTFCPTLSQRTTDKEISVKSALAKSLSPLNECVKQLQLSQDCKDLLIKTIDDCYRHLLDDKSYQVRIEAINQLSNLSQSLFKETIEKIRKEKWVVKSAFLNSQLSEDVVEEVQFLLLDDFAEVRYAASNFIVKTIMESLTHLDEISNFLQKSAKGNTSNFQNRVAVAHCVTLLLKAQIKQQKEFQLVNQVLLDLAKDRSFLVRQQIVAEIDTVIKYGVDNGGIEQVKNIINEILKLFLSDEDKDIRESADDYYQIMESFNE